MKNILASKAQILSCGLVPIVRGNFSTDEVLQIAEVFLATEIPVVEVTLNSRDALGLIATLRKQYDGRMLVGAGTVRTKEMFLEAVAAGAQFTIAPNLDQASVEAAQAKDLLHLPGVLTPTEIQNASAMGCDIVKLFPVDVFGAKYLKAVRAPLSDMQFIPTGGVSVDNLADFVKAGAVAVGIGSALVTGPGQSKEDLTKRAQAFRKAFDGTR